MGNGMIKMGLTAAGIPRDKPVSPRKWQEHFGIKKKAKSETKTEFKDRLRQKAQELFPGLQLWSTPKSLTKQRAICDALLIAEYTRRHHKP